MPTPERSRGQRAQPNVEPDHAEPSTPDFVSPGSISSAVPSSPILQMPTEDADADFVIGPSDPFSLPLSTPAPTGMLSSPLNYGTPSSLASIRTPHSLSKNTPHRRRAVISDKHLWQVNVNSDQVDSPVVGSSDTDGVGQNLVIWGTDVVVANCKKKFKEFITKFVGQSINDACSSGDEEQQLIYLKALNQISDDEQPFLNVNCAHLEQFDADICRQLIYYPQEVIPTFDMAVNELFFEKYPDVCLPHQIQIRPFNAVKTRNMRFLNPEDIDKLITVSGMVIRTSNLIPDMREAFFQCSVCHSSTSVEIDRGRIAEPTLCTNCNTSHSFNIIHNRSQFTDKQIIKLQEAPDDMPAGHTPHTITLCAHNDLVDNVQPGKRVTVTGIYRAVPIQVNSRMRNLKAVYKTHIDVLHYQKLDSSRLHDHDDSPLLLPPERIEALKALSQRGDLYERLAGIIAPSIYENIDIKKGILLQLFGGTRKNDKVCGKSGFRAELNILLCGDPGTSKSQLLSYIYGLIPKSQYTSGKGSSAVGLTAYVTKDPESRQLVLQTGALVLADNGVCCIDEFDKMNDATRSVLHEVMEQQTLSIAKAGIICQLNARTSILAAANPVESQWNKNKTIIENIKLPHTLLSRFDLIFLMLDPQSDIYDKKLARHLVSLYYHAKEKEIDELMDMSILRDYINYAKSTLKPKLSDEASEKLIHAYVEMRKVGSGRGQISAYPRQLESLIRLSEAHAKMRLSSVVTLLDVAEATRLHREALKQSATDPLSGKIDISILTTGLSMAARKKKEELAQMLKKIFSGKTKGSSFSYQKVFKEMRDSSQTVLTREMFEEALKQMQDDGVVTVSGKNTIRLIM